MKDNLEALGNDELLSALSAITGREREVTCEWLAHMGEVDARRLHEDLGFSSLWAFCTKSLGLCETTAGRRIAAARVCRQYPEAFALVASGALQVTVLSLLKPHLNPENAAGLFDACGGKSFRDVEELVAARFPKPDIKDSVRRLPARRKGTSNVGCAEVASAAKNTEAQHLRENSAQNTRELAAPQLVVGAIGSGAIGSGSDSMGAIPPPHSSAATRSSARPRLEPLSGGRFGVRVTAGAEFRELLERVRALASHRLPGGDLETLMLRGLEAYERELVRERFAVGKRSRAAKRAPAPAQVRPSGIAAAAAAVASRNPSSSPRDVRSPTAEPASTQGSYGYATVDEVRGQSLNPNPNPNSNSSVSFASRRSKSPAGCFKRSRYVPAAVEREVYARDGGQCTFVASDGRRCGARHFLQFDHIEPWAVGGGQTTLNLRLRCGAHNRWYARRYFGRAVGRPRRPKAGAWEPPAAQRSEHDGTYSAV